MEAIKGDEYWEIHSIEELLPPDIPAKLRGRPKKQRRKEHWEGGNRSQSQIPQGPVIQRFSNKRVMHCSLCKQPGHTKGKCPGKPQDDEEGESSRVEKQGPVKKAAGPVKKAIGPVKKKAAKEVRRQKLAVRRKGIQQDQQQNNAQDGDQDNQQQNNSQEFDQEQQNNEENAPENAMEKSDAGNARENAKEKSDEEHAHLEGAHQGESADPFAFLTKVPRKKMVADAGATDEWEKSGKNYPQFQERLRGPMGYKAIFMPTPGLAKYMAPGNTPPPSTPLGAQQSNTNAATQQSSTSVPKRRSKRMSKQATAFKNMPDDPVDLAD